MKGFSAFLDTKRRQWHPTRVLLPGKSRGQRSLEGCSPWGHERVRNDLEIKQLILKDITLKVCFIKTTS